MPKSFPRILPQEVKTLSIGFAVVGVLATMAAVAVAPHSSQDLPLHELTRESIPLQPVRLGAETAFVQHETVRRGEMLGTLFSRMGINDTALTRFVRQDPVARRLLELAPGHAVSASLRSDKTIRKLTYRLDDVDTPQLGQRLVIRRVQHRLVAYTEPVPIERTIETRSAEMGHSIIQALDVADIPDNVLTRIADIFGHDVNLRYDLRRGDQLRVVYETLREAGSPAPAIVGRIFAVQFRGRERSLEAVWFERGGDKEGQYYTFDGRNLNHSFLASPLAFTRVSSGFSQHRQHPITQDWRAHKGIDFSAPIGTDVRATADGVVSFMGPRSGYGRTVVLRHDKRHATLYAHLSTFGHQLHVGRKVRQGEVIGQVGQSGWATGPHLHYEFHIDGRHVDPLTVARTNIARPLSTEERARFTALANQYRGRFALLDTKIAARFE